MKIYMINGPNLNLLGSRETDTYGKATLASITERLASTSSAAGAEFRSFQSNSEGELITAIQEGKESTDHYIVNAGAYTHTSVGIRDALLAVEKPFVEVHLSNIYKRDDFRHKSYLSDIAVGVICGFGEYSYDLALNYILSRETK